MRADVRRNRQRIMDAAGELFARLGNAAQMDQIAERSGLGMGTLYRHFPNKQALLAAVVSERFASMADLARTAATIADPGEAFETFLRRYLEASEDDAAFQFALLGSNDFVWGGVEERKTELLGLISGLIERGVASGQLRADLTSADFPLVTCGVMSTMYFKPQGNDWRRHLELALAGIMTGSDRRGSPRRR